MPLFYDNGSSSSSAGGENVCRFFASIVTVELDETDC
jgi:hypothetical protein